MSRLGSIPTILVFGLWAIMNTLVVMRQIEISSLDQYKASFSRFLGPELRRERWLGIYRRDKQKKTKRKIGYTGYTFEKTIALEGVEVTSTLESKVEMDLLGARQHVEIQGSLVADGELKPALLHLEARFEHQAVEIRGERKDGKFLITIAAGGQNLLKTSVPLEELYLGDAFVPSLPVAALAVGDSFQVPCFDPLFMKSSAASVKVVAREVIELNGFSAESFRLETKFRDTTSTSWVSESGELLRQELGPPLDDIIMLREKKEDAKRLE